MSFSPDQFLRHDSIPKDHKPSCGIRGSSVLVVDDNAGDARLLQFWLQRLGCHVQCAKDGSEAVDLYQQKNFDFVLMDLDMPILDGYEATKQIRDAEVQVSSPRSKIIAISGLEDSHLSSNCETSGMDGYFSKPVCPRELAFALAKFNDHSPKTTSDRIGKSSR